MTTVTLEEAQARLPELIEQLSVGDELIITRGNKAIARILVEGSPKRPPRTPGNCRDMLTIVADDDEHLRDFTEYME